MRSRERVVLGFDGSRTGDGVVVTTFPARKGKVWAFHPANRDVDFPAVARICKELDFTLMPWQRRLLEAMYPGTAIADQDPDVWGDQA